MGYKPVHEDLRELAARILERSKTEMGQLPPWAGYAVTSINVLADTLEAKHSAGMDALREELARAEADPETPTLTAKQATDAVRQTIEEWWGKPTEAEWAGLKLVLDKHLQQNGG